MRLFLMILFVVGSVVYTPANAQSSSVLEIENAIKKDGKYALLVSNARYLQAAVRTGESLKTNAPEMDFEVVLVGPVVKDIVTDESLIKTIEQSKKLGIRLVVCEAAMNHMQLKKSDYHSAIEFTPDGFIYLFGLQESGYKTITL
ncbi:DsrE family protein [Gelidibacter sp. F2691]|nr:DsrE family protein [Gelidibacter sp. F2691]